MSPTLPPELWPRFLRLALGDADPPPLDGAATQRLLTFAAEEGLAPLLFSEAALPPNVRTALTGSLAIRALYLRRMQLQQTAARTLTEVIGSDSFVFLKGFDYRYRLYERPELRPSSDIDVYVPPPLVDEVVARLTKAGYPQVISGHGTVWAPRYFEIGFDLGEVRVEVHRSLSHRIRTTVDYDALWREREPFDAGGFPAFRLSPLHALAYHALNLAKDELAAPLIRFVDLQRMLALWPELVPHLPAIAREWQLERAVYASLRMVTTLFPSTRSADIDAAMGSLLSKRTRRFLDTRVIPDRTTQLAGHVDGRGLQLWRKYWLTDRVWRRFAFAVEYVWLLGAGSTREALSRGGVARYRAARLRGDDERPPVGPETSARPRAPDRSRAADRRDRR
jgi:hypothetical protein